MGFQDLSDFSSRALASHVGDFLTREQEEALWQTWFENPDEKAREKARETILIKHLPLCKKLAGQWAKRNRLSADDFFGEAYTEMTSLFGLYDRAAGARFSSFLEQRLQGALRDAAINSGQIKLATTKRSYYMFSNWSNLNREALREDPSITDYQRHKKIADLIRAYNPEEFKNISAKEVAAFEMRLHGNHFSSLDRPVSENGGAVFQDFLEASWGGAEKRLEDNDLDRTRQLLRRIVESAKLNDRERQVIRERHLADEENCRTLGDLAKEFGVSTERVRQIEEEGLRKVKQAMKWSPLAPRLHAPDKIL